jgi:hypothetical protein
MGPFAHREDIVLAKPFQEESTIGKQRVAKLKGATVVFRAVPGLTAEWLQRVVDCHIARASVLGHDVPEISYCPLALKNVSGKVSSVGDGFAVDVSSDDTATAQEILRRARALAPAPSPSAS